MNRPKYLWTLFFAFQGIVFALCYLFQVQGIPDDLWLIALAHIPVCMVFYCLEKSLAETSTELEETTLFNTDEYAHLFTTKELS